MPDIATDVPLPEIPPLPEVATEVTLTAESLSFTSWQHTATDCPNSWSPAPTPPTSSCHGFVTDVPLPLTDELPDHIAADAAFAEWPHAKRRRRKLANAWNDIPALVNLIVAISIEDASRTTDPTVHQDPVTSPTNVAVVSAFGSTAPVKHPSQTILPTTNAHTNLADFISLPSDTTPPVPVNNKIITSLFDTKNLSDHPID